MRFRVYCEVVGRVCVSILENNSVCSVVDWIVVAYYCTDVVLLDLGCLYVFDLQGDLVL